MSTLTDLLTQALNDGHLLPAAKFNIEALLKGTSDPLAPVVITELLEKS